MIGAFGTRRGYQRMVAVDFLKSRGSVNLFLFAFLDLREVMPMYMTWEVFFLFCTLIVAVIRLVVDLHNNNKKR